MQRKILFAVAAVMVALLLICGCTGTTSGPTPVEKQQLRIATTTSLDDTKLLNHLS